MVSLSAINGDAVTGLRKSWLSRLQQGTVVGQSGRGLYLGLLVYLSLHEGELKICICLCHFHWFYTWLQEKGGLSMCQWILGDYLHPSVCLHICVGVWKCVSGWKKKESWTLVKSVGDWAIVMTWQISPCCPHCSWCPVSLYCVLPYKLVKL